LNRITSIFTELRTRKRAALMPFITAGYPSLDATEQMIPALESAGASIIELGFPFSDPIADGPVIAASMHEALKAGVTPRSVFDLVARVRSRTAVGIVAMVSESIITRMGPEQFVTDAANAGFDGLIVPDIDLDAARPLAGLARLHNLAFTLLIAPTTSAERIKHIAELCTGFIYVLARVGITGERDELDVAALRSRVQLVRSHTRLPIAVGFGVSSAAHVAAVAQVADAAIVGSALVRRVNTSDPARSAHEFVKELAVGLTSTEHQPAAS
jgi:tryptophan synthase alpha chain